MIAEPFKFTNKKFTFAAIMKLIDDYRKLLSVTKDAELKELKTIYRNAMKDCHPDKFANDEPGKLAAEEKSKLIIEAYHFLVSIAPETIASGLEQYNQTINMAGIEDFQFKSQKLTVTFTDGNSYEYFDVPKAVYVKLVNAPAQARFARRHIFTEFVYRSVNKLVTE
jgi:preprotein translocase subunit Sec63